MLALRYHSFGDLRDLRLDEVIMPVPAAGEVLVRVRAASVNPVDWKIATGSFRLLVRGGLPRTMGSDFAGEVAEVGPGGDTSALGRRVLVRPCMRPSGFDSMETVWMGSDFDGAFADFVRVPASEVFAVDCDRSDAELGAIPCAFGTAENMLLHAGVRPSQHVIVTGRAASDALIELADTVSVIADEKHAFRAGVKAQPGIDL